MPIIIADTIASGEFSTFNTLELDTNKVKGIGFFENLSEAFLQSEAQRCKGYLACISGAEEQGVYQFTGQSLDGWNQIANWSLLSEGAEPSGTGSNYTLDLETTAMMVGAYDSTQAPLYTDNTSVPTTFEIRFSGSKELPYDIATRGLHPFDTEFGQSWTHLTGPLGGTAPETVLPGKVRAKIQVDWGTQLQYLESSGNAGFNGFSADAIPAAVSGTWSSGGTPAEQEIYEYLNALPPVGLDLNWLYIGDSGQNPVYLLYDRIGQNSAVVNPASLAWTVLVGAPIQCQVTRDAGDGTVTPNTDFAYGIVYPHGKRAHMLNVSDSTENGFATVQDLIDMRFVFTMDSTLVTHMEAMIAGGEVPEMNIKADIFFEL